MPAAPEHHDHVEKLAALVKDIRFAMLTTVEPGGRLHSRPMAVQQTTFDGDLWFFTRDDSPKVQEVRQHDHVSVTFAKPDDQKYVTMSGAAHVVDDRAKAEELWHPLYRAWFPEGLDDPHLVLMKVTVDRAEYWDSASSPIVYLIGAAKAALTGKPYQGRGTSEHGQVDL